MSYPTTPRTTLCPGTPHRWHPRPGTPCWKDVAAEVGNAPEPAAETYCCPLAAGGDFCECAAEQAELAAAMAPDRALTYDLRTDTWGWE